jgi:hypothetical protein
MLNAPWIDPRDIDWTDGLNPVRNPGWRQNNNPYVYHALQDPFTMALRQGKGIEPRIYPGFDPSNLVVPAGTTQDYEVPIEPNFWCFAFSVNVNGRDFLFNVTDSVTGATFFSQPVSAAAMSPIRNGTAGRGPLSYLSTPHLFTPPSYPIVRIINTFGFDVPCRVNLFGCVEYDV